MGSNRKEHRSKVILVIRFVGGYTYTSRLLGFLPARRVWRFVGACLARARVRIVYNESAQIPSMGTVTCQAQRVCMSDMRFNPLSARRIPPGRILWRCAQASRSRDVETIGGCTFCLRRPSSTISSFAIFRSTMRRLL